MGKKQLRKYSRNNEYQYKLSLNSNKDGSIIDCLNKTNNKTKLIKYAIFSKINRKEKVDIGMIENKQSNSNKKNETFLFNLRSATNQDLIDVLEPLKKERKTNYFIKQALYELIAKGYSDEEINEYENICNERRKNSIIMKPQFTLYRNDDKDVKIAEIIEELNQDEERDMFIKNAILEKYNRECNKKTKS